MPRGPGPGGPGPSSQEAHPVDFPDRLKAIVFLIRRPSPSEIDRFLALSRQLPLSYSPVGLTRHAPHGAHVGDHRVSIGHGEADFERARAALIAWRHFEIGWVQLFPPRAPIETGTVVAVLIRHLGCWSLNGARVVYQVGGSDTQSGFGFAYGTLTNHAESGEELFEVFIDRQSGNVMYRIRATARPRSALARIGQPIVRQLQARFRRDSAAAMARATSNHGTRAEPPLR